MQSDVHDLQPGALGLVAHEMKLHQFNGWTKRQLLEVERGPYGDRALCLTHHIPHGALVLVLSSHKMNFVVHGDPIFYQVLWNETCLFIERRLVFNPYVNSQK